GWHGRTSFFDFENPTRVIETVNELAYDTLAELIESGSQAEMFFESTNSSTERDGRRALLGLIKGALDWRPTEQTRKQQLFDRLGPEFYRAQQQADLGGGAGTTGFAAARVATGDETKNDPALKAILDLHNYGTGAFYSRRL
ncbi:hypothetical protein CYMTET_19013, partial [Cymbomonas tetramitiformis]